MQQSHVVHQGERVNSLPHSASLRRGRVSEYLGLYYITKCIKKGCELSDTQRADIVDSIYYFRDRDLIALHAFVVMTDHLHLLFNLKDDRNIGFVVAQLCRRASFPSRQRKVIIAWQDEYHDHKLRLNENVVDIVKYIEGNPVRKGLVNDCGDWKWSSAHADYRNRLDRCFLGHERWEGRLG